MTKEAAFDKAAQAYDSTFTNSSIGRAQRKRVYYWLDKAQFLKQNTALFELNCGTGYDADYFHSIGIPVIATDGSPEMIRTAKNVRNSSIDFKVLDFADVNKKTITGNAIFSNFGGLNCLSGEELKNLLERISVTQNGGEQLALVIMPRICMMESIYFFFKLKWRKIFQRYAANGVDVSVDGSVVKTYYHSPKQLKRILPHYTIKCIKPVALCLPPSYMEPFFKRHPRFLSFLNKLEGRLGKIGSLAGWSDHYILIAEKK